MVGLKIKHKENPGYKGDFTFEEIKNWDRAKDTTTPFARMESQMKEATPVLISHLAKMEANRKPWSQSNFPEELVRERLRAIVEKKSMGVERKEVDHIANSYQNDLWSALEHLESVSKKDESRKGVNN